MKKQISESLALTAILTLSGGLMDAYSYMCRGQVFANAQTGNLLLFGVNLTTGHFHVALQYICPVIAFAAGIAAADIIRFKFNNKKHFHWRQLIVLLEAVILMGVAFIPRGFNLPANSLTSLVCGAQVETFRKVQGSSMATTMCIGNLRMATQSLCDYFFTRSRDAVKKAAVFFGIIAVFIIGAVIGNFCVEYLAEKAIAVSAALLSVSFIMMLINEE